MADAYSWKVPAAAAGKRLDAWVASLAPEYSRARLSRFAKDGHLQLDGAMVRPSVKLKLGQTVTLSPPPPAAAGIVPQDLPLEVLFADDDIVVLNKAAGMVVHPGAGHPDGTLVNALLHHFPDIAVGDTERPGLVHRLDKDTTGVMVVARNDAAHQALVAAFQARDIDKVYRGFAVGRFKERQFVRRTGHKRHAVERMKFTTRVDVPDEFAHKSVKLAESHFEVLHWAHGVAELSVRLITGRTHQIRAHLADTGRPLIADALYGGVKATARLTGGQVSKAARALTRQALHAEHLAFAHPRTGERVAFTAPLPLDLQALHDVLVTEEAG